MTYEVPVVQVSRSAGGRRVLAVAGVLAVVVLVAAIARIVGSGPAVAVSAPDGAVPGPPPGPIATERPLPRAPGSPPPPSFRASPPSFR